MGAAISVAAAWCGMGAGVAGAASSSGVGTTQASTTILSALLGSKDKPLLNLGVLGDTARSTIDSKVAPASAVTNLVPASLASSLVPALGGLTGSFPSFESRTPGGNPSVKGSALNLSSLVSGLPAGVLGGSVVPSSLTSGLDANGAHAGMDASLANLSILQGLLKLTGVTTGMGAAASPGLANGTRGVAIDGLSLLNLADLLKGLGLDLSALPVDTLSKLLTNLNLTSALPTGVTDLSGVVDNLVSSINSLLTSIGGGLPATSVVSTVPAVGSLLSGLTTTGLPTTLPTGILTQLPAVGTLSSGTVGDLLTSLQGTLSALLDQVLGILGNLPLLKLDGAQAGVTTKANQNLADSKADVTAQMGKLSVLGVPLPAVDLASVATLVNGIGSTLTGALGLIDPGLANLVKVGVLDKTTSVAASDGYNRARAGLNILSVSIVPPANLGSILSGITSGSNPAAASFKAKATGPTAANPLALLGSLGVTDPAAGLPVLGSLGTGMLGLDSLLNVPAAVGALASGLNLQVGQILSASDYTLVAPAAAPAPAAPSTPAAAPSLPRTGGETGVTAMLAAVLATLALGIRRTLRHPAAD
jgi:hypothetical protein